MKIAGFKKQSLIDYPGNISSVIFTQGCNFRCGFCHNPDLVIPEQFTGTYNENEIINYIYKHSKLLDAVCISGGEPTIHKDLPQLIKKIKNIGLKVKLDSNGTNPDMLKQLIDNNMIDCIAMDIKHQLDFYLYNKTVGNCINEDMFLKIQNSINLIKESKINFIFRTTVAKGLHNQTDINNLKKQFPKNYQIQNFNSDIVLNPSFNIEPFNENKFNELLSICKQSK